MGGINSLSGLNNVNVDFRPAITTNVQKSGNANQLLPEANVAPEEAPQEMGKAKSVVRELDVLLLNAAGKSVSADAVENVRTVVESLVDMGVLTSKEKSQLQSLAENAQAKLKALDKFSGRDLAKALMQDKKTGETVWSKGFFGLNAAAKAVKSAIEAQQTLSAKLGEFTNRLAENAEVKPDLQERFTELQFQCDRRASEIDSVVFRMYDLAQKDVVNGAADDPQTKALLDATFKELMPREAILMHGTAEAFEKMNATMGAQMRPLAEKLDAFAADGGKALGKEDLRALLRDMPAVCSRPFGRGDAEGGRRGDRRGDQDGHVPADDGGAQGVRVAHRGLVRRTRHGVCGLLRRRGTRGFGHGLGTARQALRDRIRRRLGASCHHLAMNSATELQAHSRSTAEADVVMHRQEARMR